MILTQLLEKLKGNLQIERFMIAKAEGICRITHPIDKPVCADIDRMLFDFLRKYRRHYV